MVVALEDQLRPAAAGVAQGLRRVGRTVELILEPKKMKWALKVRSLHCWHCIMLGSTRPECPAQHAERLGAAQLVLLGPDEWARGCVCVKDLHARQQVEKTPAQLLAGLPGATAAGDPAKTPAVPDASTD